MPRLSRFQILNHAKPYIHTYFENIERNVFSINDLSDILIRNKETWLLAKITTKYDFVKFLNDNNILNTVEITLPQRKITKYTTPNASVYELALSVNKNSYLSHYTAMLLHELTNNIPKNVFTNTEQGEKYSNDDELEQENIDWAFSRPMRQTRQIGKFMFNDGKKYNAYLLNGKNQNRFGVVNFNYNGVDLKVTNLERTLIDIVVRPNYSGGIEEVLTAFKMAKGKLSVNRLMVALKKMNYKYPYHQLIGFYLEKSGYKESALKIIELNGIEYNFYLTYEMKEKSFSDRWKVFYPKGFE